MYFHPVTFAYRRAPLREADCGRHWGRQSPLLPQKPDQFAMFRLHAFGRKTVPPFQHLVDHVLLRRVVHKKRDTTRGVDLRISKRDAMRIEFRHKVAHDIPFLFLQGSCPRKQGCRVTVRTQTQKDQIVRIAFG